MTLLSGPMTKKFLIAGLVAVPMAFGTTTAVAGSCPGGGCGGPNAVEQVESKADNIESTVESGTLEEAYTALMNLVAFAEEKNASSSSKVRARIMKLAKTLNDRAEAALNEYKTTYFAGDPEAGLEGFQRLTALEKLPVAEDAQDEIDLEDDRSAWREARELASEKIESALYLGAHDPFTDMNRLAKRTGYRDQNSEQMKQFAEQMLPQVEFAQQSIASEQFDAGYATLIEIARLTDARKSSQMARKALIEHGDKDGMKQAKLEYEGQTELNDITQWIGEIAHPSVGEKTKYLRQLSSIIQAYPGTRAATQAQQLLATEDNQQAAK